MDKLDTLEQKLKTLVKAHADTKAELNIVKKEKEELKGQLEAFQQQGGQPVSGDLFSVSNSSNKQEIKAQLDQYIKEVDECINLVDQL